MSYYNQQNTTCQIANEGYKFTFNQDLYPYNYNYSSNYYYSNPHSPSFLNSYANYYQSNSFFTNSSFDSSFNNSSANCSINLSPYPSFQNTHLSYQTENHLQNITNTEKANYSSTLFGSQNSTSQVKYSVPNGNLNNDQSTPSLNKKRKKDQVDDSENYSNITNNHTLEYTEDKTKKKKINFEISCSICLKEYDSQANLLMHINLFHSDGNQKQCPICLKQFRNYTTTLNHLKIHTKEKKFKCDYCDDMFIDLSALNRHLRIHTGEKPFKCNLCNKHFSQSNNLKRHYKNVHQKN